VLALLRACHPQPTVAVTGLTTVLAAAAGAGPATAAILLAAVLTGQLSIGWSNDLLDVRRDAASHRRDKPLATGAVTARRVALATAGAVALTVPLSLALGPGLGALHLLAVVGGGWAYNLGLKRTPLSFLPYAVAFGALPAVAVRAAGGSAPAWLVAAGALLGMGAHLFNVLPDIDDDRATGVRGLPVLLGPGRTRVVGCALLLAAAAVLVLAPPGPPGAWAWAGLLAAAALAVGAAAIDRGGPARLPFQLALAGAAVDVVLLASGAAMLR
jgi:4-hydroxybenzoate polyprenyltransferase